MQRPESGKWLGGLSARALRTREGARESLAGGERVELVGTPLHSGGPRVSWQEEAEGLHSLLRVESVWSDLVTWMDGLSARAPRARKGARKRPADMATGSEARSGFQPSPGVFRESLVSRSSSAVRTYGERALCARTFELG